MERKSILIVAHGSRERLANQEIATLAKELEARTKQTVRYAFLDPIAKPQLGAAIDRLAHEGSTQIILLPYFLNSGRHVQKDIPDIIDEKQQHYPDIEMQIKKHVGAHTHMIELLRMLLIG